MAYKYITYNNLYEKQTYMYSEYKGMDFISEYLKSRHDYLKCDINDMKGELFRISKHSVYRDLLEIRRKLETGKPDKEIMSLVNAYSKSFEVRKRIYTGYDDNWRPLADAGFEDYESYLLFADCLLLAYRCTQCLKYYSCLLKVDDTLLSISDRLEKKYQIYFCQIIRQELEIFYQLASDNGISLEGEK